MIIDIIYAVLILLGCYWGYRRGLIDSLLSLFGIVIGVLIAVKFTYVFADKLDDWFSIKQQYLPLISFVLLFVGVLFLIKFVTELLEGVLNTLQLNIINRIAGAILWCATMTFVYGTFLLYATGVSMFEPATVNESVTFMPVTGFVFDVYVWVGDVIPFFKGLWNDLNAYLDSR